MKLIIASYSQHNATTERAYWQKSFVMEMPTLQTIDLSKMAKISLIPRTCPDLCHLQYGKAVEGLEHFIM